MNAAGVENMKKFSGDLELTWTMAAPRVCDDAHAEPQAGRDREAAPQVHKDCVQAELGEERKLDILDDGWSFGDGGLCGIPSLDPAGPDMDAYFVPDAGVVDEHQYEAKGVVDYGLFHDVLDDGSTSEYVVEKFRVRWVGCGASEDTWLARDQLAEARELVEKFENGVSKSAQFAPKLRKKYQGRVKGVDYGNLALEAVPRQCADGAHEDAEVGQTESVEDGTQACGDLPAHLEPEVDVCDEKHGENSPLALGNEHEEPEERTKDGGGAPRLPAHLEPEVDVCDEKHLGDEHAEPEERTKDGGGAPRLPKMLRDLQDKLQSGDKDTTRAVVGDATTNELDRGTRNTRRSTLLQGLRADLTRVGVLPVHRVRGIETDADGAVFVPIVDPKRVGKAEAGTKGGQQAMSAKDLESLHE